MSKLLLAFIIIDSIAALVLGGYILHLRHRIKMALSGQRKWRAVAFHHSKNLRAAAMLRDAATASANRLRELNELWLARFQHLVGHCWGHPPLDRNLEEVEEYIDQLRAAAGAGGISDDQAKAALAAAVEDLDRRLKSACAELEMRNRELAETQAALTSIQEEYEKALDSAHHSDGVIVRYQHALNRVTSDPEALKEFQENRAKFMQELSA